MRATVATRYCFSGSRFSDSLITDLPVPGLPTTRHTTVAKTAHPCAHRLLRAELPLYSWPLLAGLWP